MKFQKFYIKYEGYEDYDMTGIYINIIIYIFIDMKWNDEYYYFYYCYYENYFAYFYWT